MEPSVGERRLVVIDCDTTALRFEVLGLTPLRRIREGVIEGVGLTSARAQITGQRLRSQVTIHYPRGVRTTTAIARALSDVLQAAGYPLQRSTILVHRLSVGSPAWSRPQKVTAHTMRELMRYRQYMSRIALRAIQGLQALRTRGSQYLVCETALYAPFRETLSPQTHQRDGLTHLHAYHEAVTALGVPSHRASILSCVIDRGASLAAFHHGRARAVSGLITLPMLTGRARRQLIRDVTVPSSRAKKQPVIPFRDLRDCVVIAGYGTVPGATTSATSRARRRQARFLLNMLVDQITQHLIRHAQLIGSPQAVVFSGSVGEHSFALRRLVARQLPRRLGSSRSWKTLVISHDPMLAAAREVISILPS